ncbi:MAG: TatD family hydrolase [Candidatus Saccharibacteria bacterium]|nr:TatD family hydrolase [Candidatus Saccharibacteria bacterium]
MKLIDTHCHIHSSDYKIDSNEAYQRAIDGGVTKMICVGTDVVDSKLAISFANNHEGVFASVGVHPHEAKHGIAGLKELVSENKVVAIGEIGLDYFYEHSDRQAQIEIFEQQLQIADDANLPVIFHVREAFDDFWPIVSKFPNIRGVLHSFTDSQANANKAIESGFFIGVNGIATFTKDAAQQQVYSQLPLDKIILETDSPYLTPVPHRGKLNEPVFVREVARYLCTVRSTSVDELALLTTQNATNLFHI